NSNDENYDCFSKLTRRELQITKLIIDGYTNKEIADKLNISFNTVRTHHRNILNKTNSKCINNLIWSASKSKLF
ncbi:MAG: helix-turn-helix transcriptional regulator, partial [Bacteroidales bacterium]|nr:helix-turn-helix transcriptional regulator [Bacteroidales bacterium]